MKCLRPVRKTASTVIAFDAAASSPEFSASGRVCAAGAGAGRLRQPSVLRRGSTSGRGGCGCHGRRPAQHAAGSLPFLLTAFLFGLAAMFTPCVFPMIPITVSFFLNQGREGAKRSGGWKQATVFCLGIIVLFTGLGFLVTALTGPFGVVQLGSSPWVNGFIALVFLVFGLSLLGRVRTPSSFRPAHTARPGLARRRLCGNAADGFHVFALTSFACIGPIVGPLLVASVQTKGAQPVLGMAAFATGLALPFFAAGAVSGLPCKRAPQRRLDGAGQGGAGICRSGRDVQIL